MEVSKSASKAHKKQLVTMRSGRLRPKHVPSLLYWNVYNSCLATDMMARHSTHKDRQQRNFCHRSCCVCDVRGTTHILSDSDCSWGQPVLAVSWMSEVRYVGVCPANHWCTRHASLNSTLRRIGSQCGFHRTGVICSQRRVPITAAAFCKDCFFCFRLLDTPCSSELQQSRWRDECLYV